MDNALNSQNVETVRYYQTAHRHTGTGPVLAEDETIIAYLMREAARILDNLGNTEEIATRADAYERGDLALGHRLVGAPDTIMLPVDERFLCRCVRDNMDATETVGRYLIELRPDLEISDAACRLMQAAFNLLLELVSEEELWAYYEMAEQVAKLAYPLDKRVAMAMELRAALIVYASRFLTAEAALEDARDVFFWHAIGIKAPR